MNEELVKIDENDYITYNNLADDLISLGRFEEALNSAHKAIVLKDDYAYAYRHKGRALFKLGYVEQAMNNFKKGISI